MTTKYIRFFLFVVIMSIVGCAGQQVVESPSVPAPKEITSEEKIWASAGSRPDWTMKEPQGDEKYLYFVGLSEKASTEKEARDQALRHASQQFAKYCMNSVTTQIEEVRTKFGKASGVIDPTIAGKTRETEYSDVFIKRFKPEEWYIERYQQKSREVIAGEYYNVWLKGSIPREEEEKIVNESEVNALKPLVMEVQKTKQSADKLDAEGKPDAEGKYIEVNSQLDYLIAVLSKKDAGGMQLDMAKRMKNEVEVKLVSIKSAKDDAKRQRDPDYVIRTMLKNFTDKQMGRKIIVAVLKPTYSNTELSSEVSSVIAGYIEKTLLGFPDKFEIIYSEKLEKHIKDGADTDIMFDYALRTIFYEKDDNLVIESKAQEVGRPVMVFSNSCNLPKEAFPDVKIRPGGESGISVSADAGDRKELEVKLISDKSDYTDGEEIRVYFQANKDCYVYIFDVNSEGDVVMLFPNKHSGSNKIWAERKYSSDDFNFTLIASKPYGQDRIRTIASLQDISIEKLEQIKKGEVGQFSAMGKEDGLGYLSRGVILKARNEFAFSECIITTNER